MSDQERVAVREYCEDWCASPCEFPSGHRSRMAGKTCPLHRVFGSLMRERTKSVPDDAASPDHVKAGAND